MTKRNITLILIGIIIVLGLVVGAYLLMQSLLDGGTENGAVISPSITGVLDEMGVVTPSVTIEIPEDVKESIESKSDVIKLSNPAPLSTVSSPLIVNGQARGMWYFEATFPVILTDWDGKIIAEGYAEAQDEWMTEEFVPFETTLTFQNPSWEEEFSKRGSLILQKANASGLPEHDDALEIPVVFEE